jgi:hypothetical protein
VPTGWVLDARLTTLLSKRITVAKAKEIKTGSNLVEISKEVSKKCCFANDDNHINSSI